ncbi:MAG: helix-turn-helix domain-containing protein [Agarilytica sp.]
MELELGLDVHSDKFCAIEQLFSKFTDIPKALKGDVRSCSVIQDVRRNAFLREPNGDSPFVLVVKGQVKVYGLTESGRSIFISYIVEGEFCPLSVVRLLGLEVPNIRCVAESDLRLLIVPKRCFTSLLSESELFRAEVIRLQSQFSLHLMSLLNQVCFRRLPDRVVDLLLDTYERKNQILISLTHQELADELGSSREVISRLLKDIESCGAIKLHRGAIEVIKPEELKDYSLAG